VSAIDLKGLLAGAGDEHDRWARTINPQFVRVLRTIGFDRTWVRADGAYLYDAKGDRYLDLLGGFGMYNVGRNNAGVRAALHAALDLETPGSVQLGVTALPGLLAEALLARTPARLERVLFTSSGTEAIEAALKLGRAATKRTRVLSLDHGFHGLTLGFAPGERQPRVHAALRAVSTRLDRVAFGDLDALERALQQEDVALFLVEPVQGRACTCRRPATSSARRSSAAATDAFCVDEVQTRSAAPEALRIRALGPRARPSFLLRSRSPAATSPWAASLMSRAVHEAVFDPMENAFSHGSTFAPNELAMAAGSRRCTS
jgi:ornithine--oxo-acid transaminase